MTSQSANYGGKQANRTAYIKYFFENNVASFWKIFPYEYLGTLYPTLTPISIKNLYIEDTIFCATLINTSDATIKDNISSIDTEITDKIMNLKPSSYTLKNDKTKHIHYGFIAQDIEKEFPNLVYSAPDKNRMGANIKSVNYLEIIPLLVDKIQMMQKEIDELKDKINSKT